MDIAAFRTVDRGASFALCSQTSPESTRIWISPTIVPQVLINYILKFIKNKRPRLFPFKNRIFSPVTVCALTKESACSRSRQSPKRSWTSMTILFSLPYFAFFAIFYSDVIEYHSMTVQVCKFSRHVTRSDCKTVTDCRPVVFPQFEFFHPESRRIDRSTVTPHL